MPRIVNIEARFNSLKEKKAANSPKGKEVDRLKAVQEILGKNAETIAIGKGMAIPFNKDDPKGRKTLMTANARLMAIGREGAEWAGRKFSLQIDTEAKEVLVMRTSDGEPYPSRKGVGGRKKKGETPVAANSSETPKNEEKKESSNNSTPSTSGIKDLTA